MARENYSEWSKQDLIEEIKKLEKRKKYGIVWEDKTETVATLCKEKLPVLTEDKSKEIETDKEKPVNILIEGDNYHALSVLNYTHKGKIDVIYIDPPYNTGAKDWKYNNDYIDDLDVWRHSKWLSFMEKRIKLAKNLLKHSGFFVVAIDHYELFSLGNLCDEIFGENNRLGIISVVHKPEGRQFANFFSASNEFMLVYAKNRNYAIFENVILEEEKEDSFDLEDERGTYRLKNFIRLTDGKYSLRKNKPEGFYPIFVSRDLKKFSLVKEKGYEEALPITNKGVERVWKTSGKTFMEKVNFGEIIAKEENGKIVLYEKLRASQVFTTHWIKKEYHGYHYGTKILNNILGGKKFNFPKSLFLIKDVIKITSPKDGLILDYFAGSGTTGHAVLDLNKQDGGNRKFILNTNNEGNICLEACYPRLKSAINGYLGKEDGKKYEGLGGNLKYFRTNFVDANPTDINKKRLVDKSTEMLCLKEDCFDEIMKGHEFKVFTNSQGKNLGIIYDDDGIDTFKKEIKKQKKKFVVYVFSLDESAREEEFEDIADLVELKSIPAVILNVYRRIFK